ITAETTVASSKLAVGQQLQGTVLAQLKSGAYNVSVAGQTVQMRLPSEIRTGQLVALRVVSVSPQLSLSLLGSTNPLSTHEQIGATARLLADLAELPGKRAPVQQLGGTAVWPSHETAPDSKQLATALRAALANSGLFYESHQAEWVQGGRSTAQLLVEPQNRLLDIVPRAELNKSNTEALMTANTTMHSESAKQNAQTMVAKELIPLVQQQLHAMETHQLTWVGQVWPEQKMQWEIQGEEPHIHDEEERRWRTELELALPKLGDVHAKLAFSANGLELRLQAGDAATLRLFERAMPKLRAALAQADITLNAAIVEHA
ncbi:MAG: flagellar hook-length control protein FliK, partial [Gallionella sp.]